MSILLVPFTAYLVTLNADLWPLKTISEKVMQGKVPLFFIGLAMFKMAFFCQTRRFREPLGSGPLLTNLFLLTWKGS